MISNDYVKANGMDVFWSEIPPCEHLVQIYETEGVWLDSLEGFVRGGIRSGDGVIVIATSAHLKALEERLLTTDVELGHPSCKDQYIALDAEETLSKFIVNGWPNEELFMRVVTDLITRAKSNGRRVRAFGEMVAVLWARGDCAATVQLEHLWHKVCQTEGLSLFCAYPRIGFTQDMSQSLEEICALHSRILNPQPV